jgi:hypothetical protein
LVAINSTNFEFGARGEQSRHRQTDADAPGVRSLFSEGKKDGAAGVTTVPRALLPDLVKFFPAYIKSTSVNICTVGFSSSKIDAAKLATYPNDVDADYDVRA